MKKRLFITGLSGFVGQHLQSRLAQPDSTWELLPAAAPYDLTAPASLVDLWPQLPDAVIHLAGQTFVPEAFRDPARTLEINLLGTLNLLQALNARGFQGTFLYVSSGDVYGQVAESALPITELQPPCPRNPYAVSKLSAEFLSLQWGLSEGWPVLVARPFNHIGSGQKDNFVIASAARQINRIKQGKQQELALGNIDAKRDWGFAGDYVEAMWLMLQQDKPDDFVVATGVTTTVREMCRIAFDHVGLNYRDYVKIDPAFFRPAEVEVLLGNPAKAQRVLGWKPRTDLDTLIRMMMDADMKRVAKE